MNFNKRLKLFENLLRLTVVTDNAGASCDTEFGLLKAFEFLSKVQENCRRVYVIGNGGSAAIASHAVIDFLNVAKISAHTLHDSAVMTCMANDYGYEHGFSRVLDCFVDNGDVLIAISSSGKSSNIINAVDLAKSQLAKVITFSGFGEDNPLRTLGDINFWLPSHDYGLVEVGHQFLLHNLSDRFLSGR